MNDSLEGRTPVSKVYRTNPAMLPLLYLLPSWQIQNDQHEKQQLFEGTLLDVTELKKAEQKIIASEKIYKTIASSIPDSVICILDKEYRYLLIEGDMLEKLGYSKTNLLGCKAKDALSPQTFAEVENDFIKAFNGEIVSRENTRLGYDTITRFIPLKDECNEVYSIMTVSIDITRLKAAQRSINELNHNLEDKIIERTEELKKSNEELEAFSYSVSHDLRAPLRAISGYAGMLEEDYNSILDNEGKRQLGEIKNNAKRMGMLIDDLLNFSRLGRKEVEKSLVDMNNLARFAIDEVGLANNNQVKFNIEKLPPVMADYTLMQNVMINLISNAVKYSSKNNSPVVAINAQTGNNQITYCVSDNGVGFDMEYVHKLFGVFQRLHGNDEFPGTGVGLAIVQRIIQKHKGSVWAEGKIGEGASFYFALPLS
jgi:PAS domain S-box-containing protein